MNEKFYSLPQEKQEQDNQCRFPGILPEFLQKKSDE